MRIGKFLNLRDARPRIAADFAVIQLAVVRSFFPSTQLPLLHSTARDNRTPLLCFALA